MEKMGRREPYTSKSIDDFYRSIGLEPEEPEQLGGGGGGGGWGGGGGGGGGGAGGGGGGVRGGV